MAWKGRWLGELPRISVRACRGDLSSTVGTALMADPSSGSQPPTSTLGKEAGLWPHDRLPRARDGGGINISNR